MSLQGVRFLLVEKRSALGIRVHGTLSPANVTAGPNGHGNAERGEEEDGHDGKGKDPLEGDNVVGELGNTNGGSEDGEREAHGVILEILLASLIEEAAER